MHTLRYYEVYDLRKDFMEACDKDSRPPALIDDLMTIYFLPFGLR
jgi:hypothetical protein